MSLTDTALRGKQEGSGRKEERAERALARLWLQERSRFSPIVVSSGEGTALPQGPHLGQDRRVGEHDISPGTFGRQHSIAQGQSTQVPAIRWCTHNSWGTRTRSASPGPCCLEFLLSVDYKSLLLCLFLFSFAWDAFRIDLLKRGAKV